jgi:hypothetical protein
MTKNAINGSVINKASFPGAEAGLSLVELVGTVQVTCTIPSVSLRLTAVAATVPTAAGTASTTKRTQFDCQISASAFTSATALVNRKHGASAAAVCTTSAGVGLAYRSGATTSGTALASASNGYLSAARGASATCSATAQTIAARTLVSRNAISAPSALPAVTAFRKVPSQATGSAYVAGVVGISFKSRLIASAASTASSTASTRFNLRARASTVPVATSVVSARRNLNLALIAQSAIAAPFDIDPIRRMVFAATTQANAYADATIRVKYRLSGSTVARAVAQSAASDFASAMPAPSERLMKVPASNRRMEVTE